jgi:hypothetical protein
MIIVIVIAIIIVIIIMIAVEVVVVIVILLITVVVVIIVVVVVVVALVLVVRVVTVEASGSNRSLLANELLMMLLSHSNKDVVYASCGVLINLMADEPGRVCMKGAGVRAVVDVGYLVVSTCHSALQCSCVH